MKRMHGTGGRTDLSATVDHAWSGRNINWTPKMLASKKKMKERKVREVLEIHTRNTIAPTINKDKGVELSKLRLTWCNSQVFTKCR